MESSSVLVDCDVSGCEIRGRWVLVDVRVIASLSFVCDMRVGVR